MDLVALCRYIWLRRYFVCKVAVAGVILGVIIALSIPKNTVQKFNYFLMPLKMTVQTRMLLLRQC